MGDKQAVNVEGLTLTEWLNAAYLGQDGERIYNHVLQPSDREKLLLAWEGGEDPTEYAAAMGGKS